MSLRDRAFEGAVREIAKRRLRELPPLWKEYKRSRSTWFRKYQQNSNIVFVFILVPFVGMLAKMPRENAATGLALYGLGAVLLRACQASRLLNDPGSNYFALHVPVPDSVIFREHLKTWLKSYAWMFVVFATGLAVLFRNDLGIPRTWGLLAASALAATIACLGAAIAIVHFVPRVPGSVAGVGFLVYFLAGTNGYLPQSIMAPLGQMAILTPAGSAISLASNFVAQRANSSFSWMAFIVYVSASLLLFRQFQSSYRTLPQIEELFGESSQREDGSEEAVASISTAVAERHVYEACNTEPPNKARWSDRFIGRFLSAREKTVCRFLAGGVDQDYTASWVRGCQFAVMTLVLATLPISLPLWVLGIPGFLAALYGVPLMGGSWLGFTNVFTTNKESPFYAAFPVGFREITNVLLKVNVARTILWLPGAVIVGMAIGRAVSVSVGVAVLISIQLLFGLLCWQPMAIVLKFSKGSNDTRGWAGRRVLFVLALAFLALVYVVLCLIFFFASPLVQFAAAAGMIVASTVTLVLYRFCYDRGHWDLLHDSGD
jgi:hypothetical protein